MKNVKFILKSLISNNTCIDGGRKKPWYFAIIIFFFSLVVALVPRFVQLITTKGSEVISTYGYLTQEALQDFDRDVLSKSGNSITIKYVESSEENSLVATAESKYIVVEEGTTYYKYECVDKRTDKVYFRFFYVDEIVIADFEKYNEQSYMVFGSKNFLYHVADPNSGKDIKTLGCANAWRKFENGYNFRDIISFNEDSSVNLTATFGNFKSFLEKAYDFNRLTALWQECLLLFGVDVVVVLLMGFLTWVLTRGKNNVYRCFKFWECLKSAMWASLSPALLTCGLGFLLAKFANILFPLLVGIRVMWLTSKSLRPDGSGYAAN